jgi:ZIP family zinc transporter
LTTNLLDVIAITTFAGLATGIGSLISYLVPRPDLRYLSISLGFATGVMIFLAFANLLSSARAEMGATAANLCFLVGLLAIYALDHILPHIHLDGTIDAHGDRLCRAGIMTTIGMAIHNLPEGMTVALVSLADIRLGIAIAIHNIPEGVACSVPLYCATGDRRRSCLLSFLAGMTEPLGAILAILVLYPFLSPYVLAASTAMVAGMMVFICFDELIPVANRYGSEHLTSLGTIAGFLVMILASSLL